MKRILIKIVVLTAIFVGAVYGFFNMFTQGEAQKVKGIDDPTLPVLTMQYENISINKMFGYAGEIEPYTLRDSITLVPVDRELTVGMETYGTMVSEVTYNVISFEDGIVENGRVKTFEKNESGILVSTFHIEDPIIMGQEYMLRFDVTLSNGKTYYYYTRIVQRNGQNLNWYIDYANGFYQNCISKNLTDEMVDQLEPITTEVTSSLHYVNIHSSYDQILWGNLTPTIYKKAVPRIIEVNETTVSLGMDYTVVSRSDVGDLEFYSVSEFYRMRKAQDNVVLLDFERHVDQYFDGNTHALLATGLNIGIAGKDIKYVSNDSATIAAFVQNGEIWEYNRIANKASRVFSFHTADHFDERCEHEDYGLSISNVSEEGEVTFIVYGYMNEGVHEGENGIVLYRYTQEDNTTKELGFIRADLGHEELDRSLSRLSYINEDNIFFFCYADAILSMDVATNEIRVVQNNVDWNSFAASDSKTLVAWTQYKEGKAAVVTELNLETGEILNIEAPEKERIITLGFLGEEVAYGRIRERDKYLNETGNEIYPMYCVCLMNSAGQETKEYKKNNCFISDAYKEDSLLQLRVFTKTDSGPNYLPNEQLIYYPSEKDETVTLRLAVSDRKGTEVHMVFTEDTKTNTLLALYTRYLDGESVVVTTLDAPKTNKEVFYIYAKGHLYDISNNIASAIEIADDNVGVVLNSKQQYVWERGNNKARAMIDVNSIPVMVLKAPIDEQKMQDAVGEKYTAWNLSGCSLNAVKYQISNGYAVVAKWTSGQNILIIGYDEFNIWVYNGADEPYAIAFEDAEAQFSQMDNIFMSYHI